MWPCSAEHDPSKCDLPKRRQQAPLLLKSEGPGQVCEVTSGGGPGERNCCGKLRQTSHRGESNGKKRNGEERRLSERGCGLYNPAANSSSLGLHGLCQRFQQQSGASSMLRAQNPSANKSCIPCFSLTYLTAPDGRPSRRVCRRRFRASLWRRSCAPPLSMNPAPIPVMERGARRAPSHCSAEQLCNWVAEAPHTH